MEERYLTPQEVADKLVIKNRTVLEWLRTGKLKGVKAGKVWRIRESDLEEFLHRED